MPVTNVTHDSDTRTLVISAEFAASVERIWQVYADPRQLEKVFGPPTHPATFVKHDLTPGGAAHYFMTSPEGEKYYGWWKVTSVDEPRSFTFEDGFAADDTFAPLEDMPVSKNTYQFASTEKGTQATFTSTYDSAEALQKVLDMGVVEGATLAINQIDVLIAT
ncbi:MAG: SRPBCC domain-containing protein [Microthrixaceae bacterium]